MAPRRGDDAVADNHERAARLLEGRYEEAYTTEKETCRLLHKLADTVRHPSIDASLSSMYHVATMNSIMIQMLIPKSCAT
jgi:hypothetical protein